MTNEATAALSAYREQMDAQPDRSIGDVLWTRVTDTRVKHEDLQRWFGELGLDESFIPPTVNPVDAFRNATGTKATAKYDTLTEGVTAELMVREVDVTRETVTRHIVRELRDRNAKMLAYETVGEAVFYKPSRAAAGKGQGRHAVRFTIRRQLLDQYEVDQVEQFITRMNDRFVDLCEYLHRDAIRGMLRDYIVSLNAVLLPPSQRGIYFVHKSRRPTIESLGELARRINEGCFLHTIPLPETADQLDLVTQAFQDEIVGDCNKLLAKVGEINTKAKARDGTIPAKKFVEVQQAYHAAQSRSEEYTRVMGLAQGRAGSALELALDAVMDLANRIDHGGGQ